MVADIARIHRTLLVALMAVNAAAGGLRAEDPAAKEADGARADWSVWRGTPELTGIAPGKLSVDLKPAWRFKTGEDVRSSPVVSDGVVYVGSLDEHLYAIGLADGKKLWAYDANDDLEAPPLVVGDTVIVSDLYGIVHAVDRKTGKQRWTYETDGKILGSANVWRAPGDANAAPRVLVGSYDYLLHCLDVKTGKKLWGFETDNYINGSPAVDEKRAYISGCDAILRGIEIPTGKQTLNTHVGAYVAGSPAICGQRAYIGHYEGEFICIDLAKQQDVWRFANDRGDPFYSSPAVDDKHVVVGCRDRNLYCLHKDSGKKKWDFRTRGWVESSPVICDEKVVFASEDGKIYIAELKTGKQLWTYPLGQSIGSSPAVVNGWIVIGCDDGYLYAFKPREATKR